MGVEGGTSIGVGFTMSYADALRPFTFEKKEESHEEDVFSEKTGQKTGQKKVVDVEGGTYVKLPGSDEEWGPVQLGDAEDEDMGSPGEDGTEEFLEALGVLLGCRVEDFGGPSYTFVGFNVAFKAEYDGEGYDVTGNLSAGGDLYLSKVMEMGDRVQSLSKKMKELGFKKLPKPTVYNAFSVFC